MGYNFVVSVTSSSTKVRMTTDSSMCTKTGLSLNKVTQPAPGNVPSLCGILVHSRCHPHYAVYDIKKFYRSVRTSNQDSFLRIFLPTPSPAHHLPTPPGTSSVTEQFPLVTVPPAIMLLVLATIQTFIQDSPTNLQPAILQDKLEDTYIDNRGVGANSASEISVLQDEIGEFSPKVGSA